MRKKKKRIDNFERSSIDYFKDISKFSTLSKEEEMSLWEKYKKENDLKARDKIVKSNLKFVASVATPYIGMGLSYSDLIAEGNVGFMKAMEKFDYTRDFKTISYSVWWIKQTILEALNKRNLIKGDDSELRKESQDAEDWIDENDDKSYENKYVEDTDFSEMPDEDIKSSSIMKLLGCLNSRERDVITYYFGLDGNDELTLEEIGKIFNLTKERIRQIKENALTKLRSEALKNSITSETYR